MKLGNLPFDSAFTNESDAFAMLEGMAWPIAPICPHCGHIGKPYDLKKRRLGLKKCRACGRQFTVRVGTVLEGARLPLHKYLQAIYLLSASDKRMSAVRLSRLLKISYKSAWRLSHFIREAQRETTGGAGPGPDAVSEGA